jgi:two-component system CheB/CheR fusion protein
MSYNERLAALEAENARLRASEARLQDLHARWLAGFDRMHEVLVVGEIILDAGRPDWRYVAVNRAFETVTGLNREAIIGRSVYDVFPNISPEWVREIFEVAKTGKPLNTDRYLAHYGRWVEMHAFQPELGCFAVLALDVTARKRSEETQRLLVHELAHRVKNTLTVVQSIALQTARRYRTPAKFLQMFQSRLMALARSHNVLLRSRWEGAPLDEVVHEAIKPLSAMLNNKMAIETSGCVADTRLRPSQTLALSMALHELATNAAKYGALSAPQGVVTIICQSSKGSDATVEWVERGGPTITRAPEQSGFGFRLLTRGLALEGLEADLRFEPDGVRCTLRLVRPQK